MRVFRLILHICLLVWLAAGVFTLIGIYAGYTPVVAENQMCSVQAGTFLIMKEKGVLSEGDLVLIDESSGNVVRTVMEINDTTFLTDNDDLHVKQDDYTVVMMSVPYAGYLYSYVINHLMLVFVVTAGLFFLVFLLGWMEEKDTGPVSEYLPSGIASDM